MAGKAGATEPPEPSSYCRRLPAQASKSAVKRSSASGCPRQEMSPDRKACWGVRAPLTSCSKVPSLPSNHATACEPSDTRGGGAAKPKRRPDTIRPTSNEGISTISTDAAATATISINHGVELLILPTLSHVLREVTTLSGPHRRTAIATQ